MRTIHLIRRTIAGFALGAFLILGLPGCGTHDSMGAKAYVDKVFPVAFQNWDPKAILEVMDEPYRRSSELNPKIFNDRVKTLKEQMGPLKVYRGSTKLGREVNHRDRTVTTAYKVDAQFEKGDFTVTLILVYRDQRWWVAGFNPTLR